MIRLLFQVENEQDEDEKQDDEGGANVEFGDVR